MKDHRTRGATQTEVYGVQCIAESMDLGASRVRRPPGPSIGGAPSLTPGKPSQKDEVPARLPAGHGPESGRGGALGLAPEATRGRSPTGRKPVGARGLHGRKVITEGQQSTSSSRSGGSPRRKRKRVGHHAMSPSSAEEGASSSSSAGWRKGGECEGAVLETVENTVLVRKVSIDLKNAYSHIPIRLESRVRLVE